MAKTGIIFKNEVFECYYMAEMYFYHPNHLGKRQYGEGTATGLRGRKTGNGHAGYPVSMHVYSCRMVSSHVDMQMEICRYASRPIDPCGCVG